MKKFNDFDSYAEYSQYMRDLEIASSGKTDVALSDGTIIEVVGNKYDRNELERAHTQELVRKEIEENPERFTVLPSNGMYYTDEPQW